VADFSIFLRSYGVQVDVQPSLTEAEYAVISSATSPLRKLRVLAGAASRAGLRGARSHDLFMVQKLRLLAPIPFLDPPSRLDIYDFDDALYLRPDSALNPGFRWAKQEARRCIAYLRRARLVLAGNRILADYARRHAGRVEVIPSCVDPTLQHLHVHEPGEVVTVGWIGSRTTTSYLDAVMPVFADMHHRKVPFKLVLVGADRSLSAPWVEHRPWSLATQERELASFDLGIMPLSDSPWARGKCGYKLLQYFAAGVPAVASPVGVSADLVGSERGLLASSSGEWLTALEALISDLDERRERGALARQFVESHYSYQRWAPELATLLRSLV
jgi:glycosyltransferase involved in cell wall biosynthesis